MDSNINKDITKRDFYSAIRWWESKRLWYSLITIAGSLLIILLRGEVPNGISNYSDFYILFYWLIGANIFYTSGWGIEALSVYYLKTEYFKNGFRKLLFVIGTVFSFIWMFLLTRSIQ